MVVIAGDIPSYYYGKHPHQEVNLHADAAQSEIYRPFVKRVWRVDRPDLFPEILQKAFQLAEEGRPGPVLVSVPMDIFSQKIDTALFERLSHHTQTLHRPTLDEVVAETHRQDARGRQAAFALRRWWGDPGQRGDRTPRVRRAHELARWTQSDGQGSAARRSPADLRHVRFLGHQVCQRSVPGSRRRPWRWNPFRGGRLQFVGAGVHVQLSANQADPYRHRFERNRTQLSGRNWRRCRLEASAHRFESRRQARASGRTQGRRSSPRASPLTGNHSSPPTHSTFATTRIRCGQSGSLRR